MKRIKNVMLMLMALPILMGCSSSSPSAISPNKSSTTVTLSASNINKYVATYSSVSYISSNNYAIYHCHFVGADNCKFVDCSIEYRWGNNTVTEKATLTISGDGEANPFFVRDNSRLAYTIEIVGAKGTVEVFM